MKKILFPAVFIFIILNCSTIPIQKDLKYEKYDQQTDYAVRNTEDGFIFYIKYSTFQFFPELEVVRNTVKENLISILYWYIDRNSLEIKPINKDRIVANVGRNGLTGITSGSAEVKVYLETKHEN